MNNIKNTLTQIRILITFTFLLTFYSIKSKGQNTTTDILLKVYVLNGPQCNHSYYGVLTDSVFGTAPLPLYSIDTFTSVYIYNFVITNASPTAMVNFCAVPGPPCTCGVQCTGTVPLGNGGAITLLLCGNTTGINNVSNDSTTIPRKDKFYNSDVITLRFNKCELNNCYYVYNLNGSIVQQGIIDNCEYTLDLRHLPFGLYLLKTTPKN